MEKSTMKLEDCSDTFIKITDSDLDSFWDHISNCYKLSFNIEGQNLTDKVIIFLYEDIVENWWNVWSWKMFFHEVGVFRELENHSNWSYKIRSISSRQWTHCSVSSSWSYCWKTWSKVIISSMHSRIIELIPTCGLNDIDLGLIGNSSLKYLASILKSPHKLNNISFG